MPFDPAELRDPHGKWAKIAGYVKKLSQPTEIPVRSSDDIRTLQDLRSFSSMPPAFGSNGDEFYTHAVRSDSNIDSILKHGMDPSSSSGKTFMSRPPLVRDLGSGYIVLRTKSAVEGIDVVERSLRYQEFTVNHHIAPSDIVKIVREVRFNEGGHGIREDELARYALEHQGLDDKDVRDLPSKYQRWFHLES